VLLTITIRIVGISQIMFINPITTTHGNMIIDQPLKNSMAVRSCRNEDAMI
jgi:hypothetical protein